MNVELGIPWKRYALIAELVSRLEKISPQLGKTALQKLVYLLQEIYGIEAGYDFELYTYGPYTSRLLQDLDQVEALEGVKVSLVASALGGYSISPGEKNKELRKKADKFLSSEKVKAGIDRLIKEFGNLWAKDLELRSTIVYAVRNNSVLYEYNELAELVHEIKPKFSKAEIESVVNELKSRDYINLK